MNTAIKITFVNSALVEDSINVKPHIYGDPNPAATTNRIEVFKNSRVNPGEVSTAIGLPAVAANYANAFRTDYAGTIPSEYFKVTAEGNVVFIEIRNPELNFDYFVDVEIIGAGEEPFATWEFYSPIPEEETQMLVVSPHYLYVPLVSPQTGETCAQYKVDLFVWSGAKVSPPGTPSYSWTKGNPTAGLGTDKVNIAEVVKGLIGELTPIIGFTDTALVNLDNQVWVQYDVTYDDEEPIAYPAAIAFKGYGFGMSGENPTTPSDRVLVNIREFKIDRDGFALVPILTDADRGDVTVKSYPDNQIDVTLTPVTTANSLNRATHIFVAAAPATTDQYIEVVYDEQLITLWITDECRYDPVMVQFVNQYGQMQMLTFFKARSESLTITKEEYDAHDGQPRNGFHQFRDYNVNGKSKFRINSGFVTQDENASFRELMLTARCWLYAEDGTVTPMKISGTNFEYKTRAKERLIKYEIELAYAFDEINTI